MACHIAYIFIYFNVYILQYVHNAINPYIDKYTYSNIYSNTYSNILPVFIFLFSICISPDITSKPFNEVNNFRKIKNLFVISSRLVNI